jgi:ElaB/YqjD/DUF883 family membrane-anchored ribosome-binding protein
MPLAEGRVNGLEVSMTAWHAMHAKRVVADSASGLQNLIDSSEDLLESLKDQQGAAADRLREKVSATMKVAQRRLSDLDISGAASEAVDNTVGFIRRDPWRTVAIGALAVLAVSLLVRTRD